MKDTSEKFYLPVKMSDLIIGFHHLHKKCIIRVAGMSALCHKDFSSKWYSQRSHLRVKTLPRALTKIQTNDSHPKKGGNHCESFYDRSEIWIRVSLSYEPVIRARYPFGQTRRQTYLNWIIVLLIVNQWYHLISVYRIVISTFNGVPKKMIRIYV